MNMHKLLKLHSLMDEISDRRIRHANLTYKTYETKQPIYEVYIAGLPMSVPNFVKFEKIDDAISYCYRVLNDDSIFVPDIEELKSTLEWKREQVEELEEEIKGREEPNK